MWVLLLHVLLVQISSPENTDEGAFYPLCASHMAMANKPNVLSQQHTDEMTNQLITTPAAILLPPSSLNLQTSPPCEFLIPILKENKCIMNHHSSFFLKGQCLCFMGCPGPSGESEKHCGVSGVFWVSVFRSRPSQMGTDCSASGGESS